MRHWCLWISYSSISKIKHEFYRGLKPSLYNCPFLKEAFVSFSSLKFVLELCQFEFLFVSCIVVFMKAPLFVIYHIFHLKLVLLCVLIILSNIGYRHLPKIFGRYSSVEGFLFLQDDTILNYWNLLQADKTKLWIADKVIFFQCSAFLVIIISFSIQKVALFYQFCFPPCMRIVHIVLICWSFVSSLTHHVIKISILMNIHVRICCDAACLWWITHVALPLSLSNTRYCI